MAMKHEGQENESIHTHHWTPLPATVRLVDRRMEGPDLSSTIVQRMVFMSIM